MRIQQVFGFSNICIVKSISLLSKKKKKKKKKKVKLPVLKIRQLGLFFFFLATLPTVLQLLYEPEVECRAEKLNLHLWKTKEISQNICISLILI